MAKRLQAYETSSITITFDPNVVATPASACAVGAEGAARLLFLDEKAAVVRMVAANEAH